jgi:hypothetical protein
MALTFYADDEVAYVVTVVNDVKLHWLGLALLYGKEVVAVKRRWCYFDARACKTKGVLLPDVG